jgi:hypothetical protein
MYDMLVSSGLSAASAEKIHGPSSSPFSYKVLSLSPQKREICQGKPRELNEKGK